jgi:selenocysteine lyase/cysteine desulfurase
MNELRALLPVLNGMCYLNYGATSPILKHAAEVLFKMAQQSMEPLQFHRNEWIQTLDRARKLIAELIGASSEEIAFVTNTSHGLSMIANGIRWRRGDRVLYRPYT